MHNPIDMMRSVPEIAVRLFLGARVTKQADGVEVALDGRSTGVPLAVFLEAESVVKALKIRERTIETASDVLELRLDAENLFMEDVVGTNGVPKILFVPAGAAASGYYRARLPANMMSERGTAIAHFTERLDLAKALRYDLLWVQLVTAPILLAIVRAAKKEGVKIVYDFDDAFWCIPPDNPAAAIYVRERQSEVREMIALADFVTVSTAALAATVKEDVPVRVLHNMIPASICPLRTEPDPDRFTILWAGSPTHRRDLAVMAPALCGFLTDHAKDARFVCFGEQIPEALVPVRAMVKTVPFVDFPDYLSTLSEVGADLAVAPLESTEFNRFKSDVKLTEYAACGYSALASPVGQYPEIVAAGLPASLVPDGHWRDALEAAYEMRAALPARGQEARKWVMANRCVIKTGARQWADVAKELVQKEK